MSATPEPPVGPAAGPGPEPAPDANPDRPKPRLRRADREQLLPPMPLDGADDPDGGPVKKGGKKSVELFNLKDDPYEKTNLADSNPEKVKELEAALAGFARQAVAPKAKPRPRDFVPPR